MKNLNENATLDLCRLELFKMGFRLVSNPDFYRKVINEKICYFQINQYVSNYVFTITMHYSNIERVFWYKTPFNIEFFRKWVKKRSDDFLN